MATAALLALPLLLLATALPGGALARGPSLAPSMAPAGFPPVGASPLAPVPAASTDCLTILGDNMYQCLTYVEAGSNLTMPDEGCCAGFKAVLNSQPVCLCKLLSVSDVYGIPIDRRRGLMLPSVCKVNTPPASLCSVLGVPVPSPEASTPTAAPSGSRTSAAPVGSPAAPPPSGNGVDPGFRSSSLVLLAALAMAAVGVF